MIIKKIYIVLFLLLIYNYLAGLLLERDINLQQQGYYNFFLAAKDVVKMSRFLKMVGIKDTNFTNYIKYQNYGAISPDKLSDLYYQVNLALEELLRI